MLHRGSYTQETPALGRDLEKGVCNILVPLMATLTKLPKFEDYNLSPALFKHVSAKTSHA